jgi:uncharacterized membrane protein YhaH (DUF805 family)
MQWFMHCLRNYATFTGRASRQEYWWFYLVVVTVGLGLTLLGPSVTAQALRFIWGLGMLLPHLAVASRRMHDTGHSFWWFSGLLAAWIPLGVFGLMYGADQQLQADPAALGLYALALLPFAGFVIYLLCKQGDSGANRYGAQAPTTPT